MSPKPNKDLKHRPLLDGFQEMSGGVDVTRQARLKRWMQAQGLTFKHIAEWWDCHFSLPGKILVAEVEPLNDERRADLIARGFPANLLPEPWSKEKRKETNKQLVVYREATRRQKRIERIKAARKNRQPTEQRLVL
jgi:hypothetical protein